MTAPTRTRTRTLARRGLRLLTLGLVLAIAALVVPDSAVNSTRFELVKVHQADGADVGPDVVWVLAVGSDARPGEDMTHSRGDALQLVGIDTRTHAAADIGIPRDSWVDIPGHGYNKINSSLYFGGPQLLGQTVGNLVGIRPDYVFVTRFPYFIAMVKSIGGIEVNNPRAFSDSALRPKGFDAGRIHLNGYDAMAFSRIRHSLPRGDFDRSANQQRVLRGIQAKVRARASAPGFIERGVVTAMQHMHTDLGPAQLYELAQALSQVEPSKITNCVVQGGIGTIGGASVVLPYTSQARRYGDEARKDATLEHC
ncbi:LCP family protein [Nocardioides panaciterrulae]|uniref:LCP family protein required for cell wall assembly n=1 Tax=Nocardioides panaciterrulae TaxID=661492 RepID=A0A7Y9JAL4_9ACTN|nr:LCP family protein [Nocardioides panaciterrulae]NYD41226.1 LCP family protein required for cell wall assembly [Nocardioides panaciterrulae]